jgi:tetratricopeptide (TPR) repeat protein
MKSTEQLKTRDWQLIAHLHRIATAQFDLGDRNAALATIQKMQSFASPITQPGINRSSALGEVVSALSYVGEYDRALETVATASGSDHYVQGQLFGAMASAAASDRAVYLAPHKQLTVEDRMVRLRVLQRIAKAVEPFEFAEEKPYAYLPTSMASLGDYENALRLAREYGNGPVRYPYAHLIDPTARPFILASIGASQGKAGQLDKARETFRDALELVRRDPKLAVRLGQIAEFQADAGDFAGALKTAESVEPEQLIRTYIQIARKQQASGDPKGARETLQVALGKAEVLLRGLPQAADAAASKSPAGEQPKPPQSKNPDLLLRRWDSLLGQIAAIHAKLGDLKAANETMNLISLDDYKGRAADDIAEARTRAGDAEGALTWDLTLQPDSARVWALRGLATGALPEPSKR